MLKLIGPIGQLQRKLSLVNMDPGVALFSSKFLNGLNKLECYITLPWRGLPGTNTQA
jgi:hypothetical protein